MDNFVYDEEILLEEDYEEILDEDGVPIEIFADEPETTKVWQTTAAETTAKVTEVQITKKSVPVYTRTEYLAPETELTTITEVHSDEFTQTEELPLQTETEMAVTAVTEVPKESETEGTETAVSSVPSETGVSQTVTEVTTLESVTSAETSAITVVPETAEKVPKQSNSIAGFLLLAGVFGAAVAATVYFMKNKKKKLTDDGDISQLSAKERDAIRLNKQKRKKPKKKRTKNKRVVPKTTQKTLPYKRVCDKYLFKVDENKFSKTYRFEDVNYTIAKQEEQEAIFLAYCSVINTFDTSADIQITVHNNRVNKEDFNKMVLLRHKGDSFDHYIDVYNDMLVEKMEQGQNGIIRNKYLTVTVQAADLEAAQAKFVTIDLELANAFKKIGSIITPLTSNERINLLKDIFRNVDEKIREFDDKDFKRQAERAYCCPDYFEFKKDYFMWNDKYARTMFIKDMPASLKDNLLTDIANTNLDVMVSVNIAPVDPYKALKIVNHQLTSMRANKLQAEKKAIQSGYTSDVINEDLKHSLIEAEELLDDLRSKNQKMFLNNVIIMVTAKDFDELENNTETIEAVVRKHICSISTLKFQQEKGLQSVLPLGNCTLNIRRTLTTESTAVFLPFSAKEIEQSPYESVEDIKKLVDSAFSIFEKIPKKWFRITPVYRYIFYVGDNYIDEIYPDSVKENGVLIERAIYLDTFIIGHYICDSGERIKRGYDIYYDLDKREISLDYRIEVINNGVKNTYRVETDLFEDFDAWEFMFDITTDVSNILKQNLIIPAEVLLKKEKEAV